MSRVPRLAFPSTRWSRILAPGGGRDLEALARAYWRPVRAFLRARFALADEDAEDLAQDAFAWLLQRDLLARADPARGRFRAFLKTALANFAIERLRAAGAGKRGGGRVRDELDAERTVDPAGRTPDQVLDEAWRRELVEQSQQQLQRELEGSGRAVHWLLFRDWYLGGDELGHEDLARRHGITRTDVANWLDYAKRRFRAVLRARVADTVSDAEALQEELRWLFGGAHGGPR